MEAKKKPAKNDKTERNINELAIDLMAAQRSCPICKRPLWKEKYDTVVKGHVWMDLEIEIAPGGDHPPGVLYFQPWLRQRPIPSPNRNTSFLLAVPRSSRGLFYFWAVIKYKQLAHNGLGWQSANLGQLDVSCSAKIPYTANL